MYIHILFIQCIYVQCRKIPQSHIQVYKCSATVCTTHLVGGEVELGESPAAHSLSREHCEGIVAQVEHLQLLHLLGAGKTRRRRKEDSHFLNLWPLKLLSCLLTGRCYEAVKIKLKEHKISLFSSADMRTHV